jgi:hypothetical protein
VASGELGNRAAGPDATKPLYDFAARFNPDWIIGRLGYRAPAAHRRILLVEAA